MTIDTRKLTAQDCLVALMIAVSMSDNDIRTMELVKIENNVNVLPIFGHFDPDRIKLLSEMIFELFEDEDGIDTLFTLIREHLPTRLFETAYALACDVAAADGTLRESELRFLEETRYELDLDRLTAAAIERGARARHLTA